MNLNSYSPPSRHWRWFGVALVGCLAIFTVGLVGPLRRPPSSELPGLSVENKEILIFTLGVLADKNPQLQSLAEALQDEVAEGQTRAVLDTTGGQVPLVTVDEGIFVLTQSFFDSDAVTQARALADALLRWNEIEKLPDTGFAVSGE